MFIPGGVVIGVGIRAVSLVSGLRGHGNEFGRATSFATVVSRCLPPNPTRGGELSTNSHRATELSDRGNEEFDRGHYLAAAALFREALEAGATWVYIDLGNAYREAGDEDHAGEAYAAGVAAGDLDAKFNLAQLRSDQGDSEAAREIHRSLLGRGYVQSLDQEAWYVHEDDRDRERGREMTLQAAQSTDSFGDRAAAIYGTWLWEDEADLDAEPYLERGAHAWPEAWEPLLDLRRTAARAARLQGPRGRE